MSEASRQSVRVTGKIIDAQGNPIQPYQIIDRAERLFGADKVLAGMTQIGSYYGSDLSIGFMIDAAINSIIEDVELELSL